MNVRDLIPILERLEEFGMIDELKKSLENRHESMLKELEYRENVKQSIRLISHWLLVLFNDVLGEYY